MKKHLVFLNRQNSFVDVTNKDDESLGYIQYYDQWKCYVWIQYNDTIMSKSCLDELTEYMRKLECNKNFGVFGKKGDGKSLIV